MNKTAGIIPLSSLSDPVIGNLKQLLLLFDSVGIPSLEIIADRSKHNPTCSHWHNINEVELLQEKGLVFDAYLRNVVLRNDIDKSVPIEFQQLLDLMAETSDIQVQMNVAARLSSLMLNNEDVDRDFVSVPISGSFKLPGEIKATESKIMSLVIEQMPIPDDHTPWDNIFEFKSNSDNLGRLAGLRAWITENARADLKPSEVKDKLEYQLFNYRKSLEAHKIKYHTGILETFVVGSAELAENLLKLKLSNIAKGLFAFKHSQADLMIAELSAPGRELSYIYNAKKNFSS